MTSFDSLDMWICEAIKSYCDFTTVFELQKINKKFRYDYRYANRYTYEYTYSPLILDHPFYGKKSISKVLRMKPQAIYEVGVYNDINRLMKYAETIGPIDYKTAFGIACFGGVIPQIEYLKSACDPNELNDMCKIGLRYACKNGRLDVVEMIYKKGMCDDKLITIACQSRRADIVKYLVASENKNILCRHCQMLVTPNGEYIIPPPYVGYESDEESDVEA